MAAYIVACGFQPSLSQTEQVAGRLGVYGEIRQVNSGMWLLQAKEDALDILPHLKACIGADQPLFVARLQGDAAWEGYSSSLGNWMSDVMLRAYDCDSSEVDSMAVVMAAYGTRPLRLNS